MQALPFSHDPIDRTHERSNPTSTARRHASSTRSSPSTATAWRIVLVAGCTIAIVAAWVLGDTAPAFRDDPELRTLLHGMALIKAALAVAALALVAWRFAHPIDRRIAAGYVIGAIVVSAASVLIWQLAFILPAAVAFHVGAACLLLVAWRDDRATGLLSARRRR